jgi:hypothetical protein
MIAPPLSKQISIVVPRSFTKIDTMLPSSSSHPKHHDTSFYLDDPLKSSSILSLSTPSLMMSNDSITESVESTTITSDGDPSHINNMKSTNKKRLRFAPVATICFNPLYDNDDNDNSNQQKNILSEKECTMCWYTDTDRQIFKQERMAMEHYYNSQSCQFFVQGTIDKCYFSVLDVSMMKDLKNNKHDHYSISKSYDSSPQCERSALMALEMWTLNGFGRGLERSISNVQKQLSHSCDDIRMEVIRKSHAGVSASKIATWYTQAARGIQYAAELMGQADARAARTVYGNNMMMMMTTTSSTSTMSDQRDCVMHKGNNSRNNNNNNNNQRHSQHRAKKI